MKKAGQVKCPNTINKWKQGEHCYDLDEHDRHEVN